MTETNEREKYTREAEAGEAYKRGAKTRVIEAKEREKNTRKAEARQAETKGKE